MSLSDSLSRAVEAGKRDAIEKATSQLKAQLDAANKEIERLKDLLDECRKNPCGRLSKPRENPKTVSY